MKICYLGNSTSIHNRRWSCLLAKRGHEVHFITLNPTVNIPKVKVHSLFSPLSRYLEAAFILKKNEIRSLVEKLNPDILHGHYLADYGFYASALNFHPLVVSTWGSDVLVHPKKSLIYKWRVKTICRKADAVTAETQMVAFELHENFKVPMEKIKVFPWGIDLGIFCKGYAKKIEQVRSKLKLNKSTRIVFSPRSVKPIYGINTIVDSIPCVLKKFPDTVFVFIGGYADTLYERTIKEKIETLKIKKNVMFLDSYFSDDDMAIWYNLADVFVSASQSDTISLSVLEGMACGSVPVVSDIKGNKELIMNGKNGFVFALGNKDTLAENIIKALKGGVPVKKKFEIINKTIILEKYNIESSIKTLEKIYLGLKKQ